MKTILLSGARAPIALELARSFKNRGYRVIMVDTLKLPLSRFSKAVDAYFRMPSPRFEPKKFVSFIQKLIQRERISDFIPTCEEVFYVSMFKQYFDCKVWTAEIDLMAQLHNKYRFSTEFSKLIPTPKTVKMSDFEDWQRSKDYVFKPIYSRFGTTIIKNEMPEKAFFEDKGDTWIAQSCINGHEICIYSIWDAGQLKAYSAYQPSVRVGKGASIYFEPIADKFVYKAVAEFGKAINFTGQLSFDVMVDESGAIFFIECNPRATSGGHLINNRLAKAFEDKEEVQFQDNQAKQISTMMLFSQPLDFLKKGMSGQKDIVYNKKDLAPFLLQGLGLTEFLSLHLRKKISLLEASTYDIEWNGGLHDEL